MVSRVTKSIFLFSILLVGCGKDFFQDLSLKDDEAPIIEEHDSFIVISRALLPKAQPCPDDMVHIDKYCIDRYEAPNQKGAYPFSGQTAYQANNYCQAEGKSLCTQERWYTACTGPRRKQYPYGNFYQRGVCNDNKYGWVPVPWDTMGTSAWSNFCKRQYKGDPSGSHSNCVSDYGVYDLTGNVAEWVAAPQHPHKYVVKGGYWYGVMQGTPTCKFSNEGHTAGFSSYEFGFRCCKPAN